MMDENNRAGQCAAECGEQASAHAEWFCCWSTLETLARDAGALYEKCGGNCTIEDLSQWRERVLAQVHATLAEEEKFFAAIKNSSAQAGAQELSPAA